MVLVRGLPQSIEWIGPLLLHVISLRVLPGSAPVLSGSAAPDVFHRSPPESPLPTSGCVQTVGRLLEVIHLVASAPTSTPFGFRCNGSAVFAPSAHSPC